MGGPRTARLVVIYGLSSWGLAALAALLFPPALLAVPVLASAISQNIDQRRYSPRLTTPQKIASSFWMSLTVAVPCAAAIILIAGVVIGTYAAIPFREGIMLLFEDGLNLEAIAAIAIQFAILWALTCAGLFLGQH